MNNFPNAPPVPIILSVVKFTESMMMMNSNSGDLILGHHTDTYDKIGWDFKTPKLIFPHLNNPNRIAKKNGLTLFDPITGQRGWVLPDAILNNMIVLNAHDLEMVEFDFDLDTVLSDKNWQGIFLDKNELHEHVILVSGMMHKKVTPMFDAISTLFGCGNECDVCGCPREEGDTIMCHGCGKDNFVVNTSHNDISIEINLEEFKLGEEWE